MTPIPDEAVEALLPCPLCDGAMHLGADYDGDPMWSHPSDAGGCPLGVVHIYAWDSKAIAAWNRRAPHLVPDKGEVGVKALEWRTPTDHPKDPDESESQLCADGLGGVYAISKEQHVGSPYLLWWAHDPMDWSGFASIEAAKAAAQADYEGRIRSALYLKPLPPERGGEDRVAELERELAEALHWKGVWKANATEVIGQRDAAEAELHRLKSADHSTGNMEVKELVDELRDGLNVTDEELLRIRNSAEKDGDVKIWARMLQKIVDHVRRLRAARVQDGWPSVEETARAMAADSRAWREAGYAPDMASALVPGNRGETATLTFPPLSQPRAEILGSDDDTDSVSHALSIAAMATPCRDYQGAVYFAHNEQYPDAEFRDYGLARAFRVLCNNARAIKAALSSTSGEPTDEQVEALARYLAIQGNHAAGDAKAVQKSIADAEWKANAEEAREYLTAAFAPTQKGGE